MLTASLAVLSLLCLSLLYVYLNDRKLRRLPPDAAVFSPDRFTPQSVQATAETLSKAPLVIKDLIPPRTGRRYIVVGGTGFLGGWIVLQLLERGEDPRKIRVLDIRAPSRLDLRSGAAQQVTFLQVDVSNADAVLEAFNAPWPDDDDDDGKGVTVFHAAANIRFYERHERLLARSSSVNYDGTLNVINASKHVGANTLVYTSSASVCVRRSRFWLWPWERQPTYFVQVYGDDDGRVPKRHDDFFSNYAVSKLAAEKAVRAADKSPTSRSHTLRTGCVRPGNGIFGPGGDLICEAYLVRKHNLTWVPNILQSFVYVENGALAHLCYEQRLIELERGSVNPDIGGQAFMVTDAGPPATYGDFYTAICTLDAETTFQIVSPTLMLALAHVIETLYVSKALLARSDSSIGRAIARAMPTISGDVVNLQSSIFPLTTTHLIFDDARARLAPAMGGLGYAGPYTTLQGICKTVDGYFKSDKSGEERSMSGGVSLGWRWNKSKAVARHAGKGRDGATALN